MSGFSAKSKVGIMMKWLKMNEEDTMKRKELRLLFHSLFLAGILLALSNGCKSPPRSAKVPIGASIDYTQVYRNTLSGDNYHVTWADDGYMYVNQDDGDPMLELGGDEGRYFNNRVWRMTGSPDSVGFEYLPNYPYYEKEGKWYAYGIISIDGILYSFITLSGGPENSRYHHAPFRGTKLLYSADHGNSWKLHDGRTDPSVFTSVEPGAMFFMEGQFKTGTEADPRNTFSWITCVQMGQDGQAYNDGYAYFYSPDGMDRSTEFEVTFKNKINGRPQLSRSGNYYHHELNLARAPRNQILNKDAWEFFVKHDMNGGAVWSANPADRGVVCEYDRSWSFYSWSPSVVYNEPLGLFIMINSANGWYPVDKHNRFSGNDRDNYMALYYSDKPWGPWTKFHEDTAWVADDHENDMYQAALNPKWISSDGREMYMMWSDRRDNYSRAYYTYTHQKIVLLFDELK
jgi:hypothetical protein